MCGLSGAITGLLSATFGGELPGLTSSLLLLFENIPLLRLACFLLSSASQSGFFACSLLVSVEETTPPASGLVIIGVGGLGLVGEETFVGSDVLLVSLDFSLVVELENVPKASWKVRKIGFYPLKESFADNLKNKE